MEAGAKGRNGLGRSAPLPHLPPIRGLWGSQPQAHSALSVSPSPAQLLGPSSLLNTQAQPSISRVSVGLGYKEAPTAEAAGMSVEGPEEGMQGQLPEGPHGSALAGVPTQDSSPWPAGMPPAPSRLLCPAQPWWPALPLALAGRLAAALCA